VKRLRTIPFFKDSKAASYTISAMIITAVTVTLVVAAFAYAY